MIITKTASEYRHQARQANFLKGFISSVLLPKIDYEASFGKFRVEIFLNNFPQFVSETRKDLLEFVRGKGFKANIDSNDILTVDWS